ncbi:hypothetical protein OHB56_25710 [Streptomyces sp. NBC_01635]|uniref:hypothetical protein n=1 Tax=Streptomyces sp. NBC_01635 TaxID=2975904 RepID=UPI003866B5F9|nr:hypothetical protein OHB56_25710 [Streptomyces sp. NBC_01635]
MIYRHHIAPPRAFTQLSHEIIRHPRLTSDAVRLLTWQLSLPQGAREPLSRTAERARIGGSAFTRAKRQLKDEGFVHERRVQGPGGRWATQQLVSSTPLSAAEAAKLLARMPVGPAGGTITERVSPQLAPGARIPAVGEPTTPPTDGHPKKDSWENTSHRPPEPPSPATESETETATASASASASAAPETEPQPETTTAPPLLEEARALVSTFPGLSPALRHIPRAMHAELADLTARWLAAGHPPTAVRLHILRGLPDDGSTVHRPGGLLRYLLRDVPPVPPVPTGTGSAPEATPPPRGASPEQPLEPRLSPRLAGARECAGDHIQPTLFRPITDEALCRDCTARSVPPK